MPKNPVTTIVPSDFFILRSPLRPIDVFHAWSEDVPPPSVDLPVAEFDAAWQRAYETLRGRLIDTMGNPDMREALFVASPGFESRFDQCTSAEPSRRKHRKYDRALLRYFARMCGRATPLGLAAGWTFGTIGSRTRLVLEAVGDNRRRTRIDVDYLAALVAALLDSAELEDTLALELNSSLYQVAGRFHYVRGQRSQDGYVYAPVAVERSLLLDEIVSKASSGATLPVLRARLRELVPALDERKAAALIGELIGVQILVPAIAPAVTGDEPLERLIEDLDTHPQAERVVQVLTETRAALADVDRAPVTDPVRYRGVASGLDALPAKADVARLFQVELIKPAADATLAKAVVDEVARGLQWLHGWVGPGYADPLETFRDAFRARYGEREVRLVEALDEETGIGARAFGAAWGASPLLEGLPLPETGGYEPQLDVRHDILLRRLGHALAHREGEIRMSPDDLDALQSTAPALPLPHALAVKGSLAAASDEALSRGEYRFHLHGAMGPPATILLGRHGHADEHLCDALRAHVREEAERMPDAVIAEVVYSPPGRLGNIQVRPVLSEYEIPYLGRSALPAERQISVDDLLICLRNDRLVLRSARLGRRVIPRMSSAHNFRRDQNVIYRLLCSLQIQGVCWWLRWDWGALRNAPFLPRVTLGRLVLSRAAWHLDRTEIQSVARLEDAGRFAALRHWRRERGVPRQVMLIDADEEMPCDLENVLGVDALVESVKDRDSVTLEEMFPEPDQLGVRGPEGRFVHDLVIPYLCHAEPLAAKIESPASAAVVGRTKLPGSDWLYLKLYSGPVTMDRLLRELVEPIVRAIDGDLVTSWFFVRYADPEPHLRLRLQGDPAYLQRELLPRLHDRCEPLVADSMLWRIVVDTYEREVDRYGGNDGMAVAERLFHADSIAALTIVGSCVGDAGEDARWRLALKGIDMLFDDFGTSLAARARVIGSLRKAFGAEFGADRNALKHRLGQRYREARNGLAALIDEIGEPPPQFETGMTALRQRSASLRPVAAELDALNERGALTCTVERLLHSYVHMQSNRILRWPHRPQELVVYDYLARHYESQLARMRRGR